MVSDETTIPFLIFFSGRICLAIRILLTIYLINGRIVLTQKTSILGDPQQPDRPWAFWLLFFFQYAAIAAYYTYLNVYYRKVNLTGTEIGLINMAISLVGVAFAIFWGNISDRTGRPRYLISLGAVGALVIAQFVPTVSTFSAFLLLGIISSIAASAPGTLTDSTTLAWLGERREDYARYRLGGTFGYVITGTVIGFIFDRIGLRMMFPLYGVIMLIFAIFAQLIPDLPVRLEVKSGKAIGEMIHKPVWIIFTICVFLVWIASNASIMFMGVVLDSMGAPQGLIGLAVTIGAIVEIPFMMYSPRLLRRFGPERILIIALSLMVVRYFLLSWMPEPWWAIPINIINGPAFVFFWNGAVTLANRMAPQGLAGTVQGMFNSTMNLAGVVSALLTGILFDRLGPNGMFLVMAFCVLAAFLLFAIANFRSIAQVYKFNVKQ